MRTARTGLCVILTSLWGLVAHGQSLSNESASVPGTGFDAGTYQIQVKQALTHIADQLERTRRNGTSSFGRTSRVLSPDKLNEIQLKVYGETVFGTFAHLTGSLPLFDVQRLPLPCAIQAMVGHQTIHFSQLHSGGTGTLHVENIEQDCPAEDGASYGEMHYARFFCNFDELNYEQKTLYLALTDEKGIFHNFIHMRVPNEPTEKDFKAYEMRSPENLNEEFSAFLSDVIQVYETAAKAKESLSPTQMQEQYRRIKAVQMQVGRILFEAGRTNNTVLHEVLARGRGVVPREERAEVERLRGRAQHFDTLQQDYHVVAKDLKALQESIWKEVTDQEIPDPESAKQQISRNYL